MKQNWETKLKIKYYIKRLTIFNIYSVIFYFHSIKYIDYYCIPYFFIFSRLVFLVSTLSWFQHGIFCILKLYRKTTLPKKLKIAQFWAGNIAKILLYRCVPCDKKVEFDPAHNLLIFFIRFFSFWLVPHFLKFFFFEYIVQFAHIFISFSFWVTCLSRFICFIQKILVFCTDLTNYKICSTIFNKRINLQINCLIYLSWFFPMISV